MKERNNRCSLIASGGLIQSAGALAVGSVVLLSLLGPTAAAAQGRGHDSDRHHRPSYSDGHGSDRHHRGDRRDSHHDRGNRHDGGHHYDRHHDDRHYRSQSHHGSRQWYGSRSHFEVPRHLHRQHYSTYEPYYRGQTYYSDHRHYHRTYRFPVWHDGYASYQTYAYCGSSLFRPRFGLRFFLGF